MSSISTVKKAVFPVAGMGLRFLPATKANPKEMLPIVDKPLIQYAVEEALKAGLTDMIFVTNSSKRAIEDHFDSYYELEKKLLEQNKTDLYDLVKAISPEGVHFTYVRQQEALGLGHALLCAKHIIGNDPFAVLLADDLIEETAEHPCLSEMVKQYVMTSRSIVAVQAVPELEVDKYGIVDMAAKEDSLNAIRAIIEKPALHEAPSNLAAVGRYIFTPRIFDYLEQTPKDQRGEIQLTDAIAKLIQHERVDAFTFEGKRYDCGSKLGYVKATIEYALKHPEIGASFKDYWESR